jgi:HEAT repeat protein
MAPIGRAIASARMTTDDPLERAAALAALGLAGQMAPSDVDATVQAATTDPDARVRAAALGALVRAAPRAVALDAWRGAATDRDATVRRRAAELAPALAKRVPIAALLALLADGEPLVAEAAAFALGERAHGSARAVTTLARVVNEHDDPLVREAAVAALGALGDERGLPAILVACNDRPAIRRRAVIALAAFEGDDVEAAINAALEDHDWQVRQAAEDLISSADPIAP